MKIVVFGSNGMLGRAVADVLRERGDANSKLYSHMACDITDPIAVRDAIGLSKPDVIINCAGIRPQDRRSQWVPPFVAVNALGPHVLAHACESLGARMIQVSTDGVFSGRLARPLRYSVDNIPDPIDIYGVTKRAGEPDGVHVLVVRTSFIGPQPGGLWTWLVEEDRHKRPVEGWANAFWTGSTVDVVAEKLVAFAHEPDWGAAETRHLATEEVVDKSLVLAYLKSELGLSIAITKQDEPYVNRALWPTHGMMSVAEGIHERISQ